MLLAGTTCLPAGGIQALIFLVNHFPRNFPAAVLVNDSPPAKDGVVLKKIARRACELELEGIVSKRIDGRYQSGRTAEWVKVTCRRRTRLLSLAGPKTAAGLMGYISAVEDDALVYAGKLEKRFTDEDRRAMLNRLKPLRSANNP